MKKIIMYGTLLFLCLTAASCRHDDDRQPVLPPTVEAAPNTLSGVITNMSGEPVVGATVELGNLSVQTNADGAYTISGVAVGDYEITASATGMLPASAPVKFTQAGNQNLLWSVALNRKVTQDLVVTQPDADASGSVESENIPQNEVGAVDIKVNVPANTVPKSTTISITPIYSEGDAAATRAQESETMLIGATVTCSDLSITLAAPLEISFALDASVTPYVTAKEYNAATDTWSVVAHSVDAAGNIVIRTTKFTSFGIFLPVSVSTTSSSEPVAFAQSLFDNRNGGTDMPVEAASFSFKTGTKINSVATNKLQGLLIEHLARLYGSKVTDLQGRYPLNITLKPGQGVNLSGSQTTETITMGSGATTVTGTRYGTVSISVSPFSVDHNGGAVGE